MKTIYKYKLELKDKQTIKLPIGAEILTIQMQDGVFQLWALVSESASSHNEHTFFIYGTGFPIPNPEKLEYITTLQRGGVWHIFKPKKN